MLTRTSMQSVWLQVVIIVGLWVVLAIALLVVDEVEFGIPITAFIAVPAAVIGVGQLFQGTKIQRAAYIKDYALKFRTDKELSESFHFLVYRYGNSLYEAYIKKSRTAEEERLLEEAQKGLSSDLKFYNPIDAMDSAPERRLDNLLGFFDVLGYDYRRGLISLSDVAGVFGLHLDHLLQRKAIMAYLKHIQAAWPQAKTFGKSPTPYRYLFLLMNDYEKYREKVHQEEIRENV